MGVKQLIPLGARSRLKWMGLATLDTLAPVRVPRVPPRRYTSIGGGSFVGLGESFVGRLVAAGLRPDDCVLDIGCGQGRMARALLPHLGQGRYEGFDIDARAIQWCQSAYRDVPHFHFRWLDVFNSRYNPTGRMGRDGAPVHLPYADGIFDMVIVASVFTHMREAMIATYIPEMARVMEPGGGALVTVLLRDREPPARDRLGFEHDLDSHSWTTLPEMPEAAIALEEDWFRRQLAQAGLVIDWLERGTCFSRGGSTLQDFVMLRKA